MRTVLVSGATGFVGQHLVAKLTAQGDRVLVLSRHPSPSSTTIVWTPEQAGPWQDALAQANAVIHLAGEPILGARWTEAKRRRIYDSRVRSTEQLVAGFEKHTSRPAVFVCASAVGFYGPRAPDEELEETAAAGGDFLAQVVRDWEAAAHPAEALGIRVVTPRLGIVLGKEGGALAQMLPAFRAFLGGPLGSGDQVLSWIHIDDLVNLLLFALDNDKIRGPLNATAPAAVTMNEFAVAVGQALGRPSGFRVPAWSLRLLFGHDAADALLTGQRVVPRQAERFGFAFRHPTLPEALASLIAR